MCSIHSKRKVLAHVIENDALQVLNSYLPKYWTTRNYIPDYGIDLDIEMFEPVAASEGSIKYDTLGEHLFAQVKGTRSLQKRTIDVLPRFNIEKIELKAYGSKTSNETLHCEVIDFQIDTSELFTVQRMGAALPVVLFLVDISQRKVFFLCLNDYIDKVILPVDPSYTDKASKVLHIPIDNQISENESSLDPLRFLAKRVKFYSFFQKVNYQRHELEYVEDKSIKERCRYFAKILLQMDLGNSSPGWLPLKILYDELNALVSEGNVGKYLHLNPEIENMMVCERDPSEYNDPGETYSAKEWIQIEYLRHLWNELANIGRIYEDNCREWYLPTWFGISIRK